MFFCRALIRNDLAASFEGRNEYISRLCRYSLLILDDFGMERGRWKSFIGAMPYLMYEQRHSIDAANQKNYIFIRTKNHRFNSCKPPNRQ